jgi:hypothetical protein
MALFNKTKMSAPMGLMDTNKPRPKPKKKDPTKDKDPVTRKSLFGNQVTRSRSTDEKGRTVKSKFVQRPDGSSVATTKQKKPGLKGVFDRKLKTTITSNADRSEVVTQKKFRQKGILPRKLIKTEYQPEDKTYQKGNLIYKLGSKKAKVKMGNDIRSAAERVLPENCLKGSTGKKCKAGL